MACVLQGSVCSRVVALIGIDKDDENGTPGFGSIGDGNGSSVRDEAVCVDHKLDGEHLTSAHVLSTNRSF